MKNYIPQKVKYFNNYANANFKRLMQLRYGINSKVNGFDYTDDDVDWMRFELINWQENEDHDALTRSAINYTTWLGIDYDNDEAALNPGLGNVCYSGHIQNSNIYSPSNLSLSYNHGHGQSQNIIEVNAGGCITRINLNPAITINHNSEYVHTQSVPSATWVIAHNMSMIPNVFIQNTDGIDIEGVVEPTSNNIITIHFNEPVAGTAYLS